MQALVTPVLLLHTTPIGAPPCVHVTAVTFADGWRSARPARYQLVPSQPPEKDPVARHERVSAEPDFVIVNELPLGEIAVTT